MKINRNNILIFLCLITVFLTWFIWWGFFKYNVNSDSIIDLTLPKEHPIIKNHMVIYTTRLINIDFENKKASIEVKFPNKGWKTFSAKVGEQFPEIGYHLKKVNENEIIFSVWCSGPSRIGYLSKYLF